jgi:hypothetical protein
MCELAFRLNQQFPCPSRLLGSRGAREHRHAMSIGNLCGE